jgi:hypothetical protein
MVMVCGEWLVFGDKASLSKDVRREASQDGTALKNVQREAFKK